MSSEDNARLNSPPPINYEGWEDWEIVDRVPLNLDEEMVHRWLGQGAHLFAPAGRWLRWRCRWCHSPKREHPTFNRSKHLPYSTEGP